MKTLVLATVSAVAMLAAGVASAQSTASSEGRIANGAAAFGVFTGSDVSRPTDGANPFNARSYVAQVGDNNTANVDQVTDQEANFGKPLNSTVLQGWGGGQSTGSQANVTQRGTDNLSVVMQRNYPSSNHGANTATVGQAAGSSKNNAFTYQYSQDSTSNIQQAGKNTGAAPTSSVSDSSNANNGGAFATSFHGADQSASHLNEVGARVIQDEAMSDSATVSQDASSVDNAASAVQWYAEHDTANITQGGTKNSALSYQTGSYSTIGVNQAGGHDNKAEVYQVTSDQDLNNYGSGIGNTTNVTQSGAYANALVLQGGNNNVAGINQSGTGAPTLTQDAGIRQVGSFNTANTTQSGLSDHSLILQDGTNNNATVGQAGAGDYSLVKQSGSNNYGTVNQSQGFFEVSKIDQSGTENQASVNQTGRDAFSNIVQIGTGARNNAYVTQSAFSAVSFVNQSGGNNAASVYQH